MRTYAGRPSSSIRFSASAAKATSVACRPSVWKRSPSPTTRFHRGMSDSTRARQLYPDALCQPVRPRSAIHRRWASRCLGAVSAASLGSTARSCPRRPAPRHIRAPRPRRIPTGKRSSSSGAIPVAAGRGRAQPCALRRLRRTPQRDPTAWRSAIVAARPGPRANPPTRPSAADGRTDSPAPAATYRRRSRRSPAAERRHLHPDHRD